MASLVMRVEEAVRQRPHAFHDELDAGRGIGHEDEIKVLGVRVEEAEKLEANILDLGGGELGRP